MTISRLTVDKLGVRLYDKVSAVLAELIANSYDADATKVEVFAPMGQYLAQKAQNIKKEVQDKGFIIEVRDNGIGMTSDEVNAFYLRVGAERRNDPRRGEVSRELKRKVMGRKGVGKLAPFGICERIEVLTAGGELVDGIDANGNSVHGYIAAHLILDRGDILTENDTDYYPKVGELDGVVISETGTTLKLSQFSYRLVPTLDDLEQQIAQRFGIKSPDWNVVLLDNGQPFFGEFPSRAVGDYNIPTMDGTLIRFDHERDDSGKPIQPHSYRAFNPDGSIRADIRAGFEHDERFYHVTGWVAYSKDNYRDELMAGVRIYCRGKIAAQPSIFNLKSGFTGEYDIRSYLVGELHADWLDESEDLIQTDRRDILWSSELGQAFEVWGQAIVKKVGAISRNPMKKKAWDLFREASDIDKKVTEAFPMPDQKPIRTQAIELAKLVGQTMREGDIKDNERTEAIVSLSLALAPHVTLDAKLREAADSESSPLAVITGILKAARIAELSSFGQIAEERIRVIERIGALKDDANTLEAAFQELIEQAPWLIDPQWSPITANQSFATLRTEFEKYYKEHTGEDITLNNFTDTTKRSDFVLSNQDSTIQIIEIKRPKHKFEAVEFDRLNRYHDQMSAFLADESNKAFTRLFSGGFHITLVCDEQKLSGVHKNLFDAMIKDGRLTWMNWKTFLLRTRRMHEQFLQEAERQKRDAARNIRPQ